MKANQNGFTAFEVLVVVVLIGLIGIVGWLVYDRQKKDAPKETSSSQSEQSQDSREADANDVDIPEGWVRFNDSATGVSFYHPADWSASDITVTQASAASVIKGSNFGPYAARYTYKDSESRWYAVDYEGNQTIPSSERVTSTNVSVSTKPALYGWAGEGGGVSYHAVFIRDTKAYMIELPVIIEETDSTGFDEQKQAIAELVKTILFAN